MREHLAALAVALAPLGYPVHLFDAVRPSGDLPPLPYLVLAAPSWSGPSEVPLCDVSTDLDVDVRVTGAATTPEGAVAVLSRVRGLLSPGLSWSRLVMEGRHAQVRFVRAEYVGVDRDVALPSSGRHPGFGVDTYRLHSIAT